MEDAVGGRRSGATSDFDDTIFLHKVLWRKDASDLVPFLPNRTTIARVPRSSISSLFESASASA